MKSTRSQDTAPAKLKLWFRMWRLIGDLMLKLLETCPWPSISSPKSPELTCDSLFNITHYYSGWL